MKLQTTSLTEEFWVCSTSRCNHWLRRSTVIPEADELAVAAVPGMKVGTTFFPRLAKTLFRF